ncbi:BTB domain-containing protein [Favolaschia claudopus]|uniref:BTB domain-containing protein n=1 Tax=Favolaschia claudopus TaxID=2862362 RepID=A0AAW0AGQ9_9AGAR
MSSNASHASGLQQVSKLWFEPDMVVIHAGDRIFRVLGAILKQKSSVFADMFAFPQPSSNSDSEAENPTRPEMMDGVPVVTVYDDPTEMEVFLQAIYDSDFFMPPPKQIDIRHCLGILRLAHKYDVPYLRVRALEHLDAMFPTSLPEFISCMPQPTLGGHFGEADVDNVLRLLMATIAVATEVGALWFIPIVYCFLLRGWDLSDIMADEAWSALTDGQRAMAINGYVALTKQWHKVFSFVSIARTANDAQCDDWADCNRKRLGASRRINNTFDQHPTSAMYCLRDSAWPKLCQHCLAEAKTIHESAKQHCWDELPTMFGFPRWGELQQMRIDALGL